MKNIVLYTSLLFSIFSFSQRISINELNSQKTIDLFINSIEGREVVYGSIIKDRGVWIVNVENKKGVSSFMLNETTKTIREKKLKNILNKTERYFVRKNSANTFEYEYVLERKNQKWNMSLYERL